MNINKLIHGPNVAGQSLVDRVMAAKHSLAGQGLAKSVCKATTEEISPPKKKHVDYLVQCTNEPNVSVPQMAGLLLERGQNSSWVVAYKALLTSHSLMNYGNEKFTQYLASNNCTFNLENFTDKSSPQGYDMSPFVRRYARYLNEKAFAYRQMAFDFCKVKKGKDDGVLRVMEIDKLLKALPVLQGQVDKLLEFEVRINGIDRRIKEVVTKTDLNNMVIRASFMMLFKDLIRLLACYNDAIINLLAKFFEMNRKQCKEALDLYKKFVTRMEGVEKFFKVAESVGIDKGDIPDLAQAPSTLLDALEAHMKSLEGSKKGSKPGESVTSAISNLAAAAQSAGNAQTSDDTENYFFDVGYESEDFPTASGSNNPFSSLDTTTADEGTDLTFDPLESSTSAQLAFPCDDLLGLSDPFAEISDEGPSSQANNPFLAVATDDVEDPWSSQAPFGGVSPSHVATSNSFATDEQFAAAFDAAFDNKPGADGSQSVTGLATTPSGRAPSPSMALFGLDMSKTSAPPRSATPEMDFMAGIARAATPVNGTGRISPAVSASPIHQTRQKSNEKLIKGDLDSSLALLADSLTIQPSGQVKKTEHNWTGGVEEKRLTGGSSSVAWSHQSTTTTTFSSSTSAVSSAQALPHAQPTSGSSPSKDASLLPSTTTTTQQPPAEIDLFGDLLGN